RVRVGFRQPCGYLVRTGFARGIVYRPTPDLRPKALRCPVQTQRACLFVVLMIACGPVDGAEPSAKDLADDKAVVAFYKPDEVQSVHLSIADKDLKRMMEALPELIEVPASFRWRDVTIENVSVRFKGQSSSNPKQTHKRSYLIKFDKSDKD